MIDNLSLIINGAISGIEKYTNDINKSHTNETYFKQVDTYIDQLKSIDRIISKSILQDIYEVSDMKKILDKKLYGGESISVTYIKEAKLEVVPRCYFIGRVSPAYSKIPVSYDMQGTSKKFTENMSAISRLGFRLESVAYYEKMNTMKYNSFMDSYRCFLLMSNNTKFYSIKKDQFVEFNRRAYYDPQFKDMYVETVAIGSIKELNDVIDVTYMYSDMGRYREEYEKFIDLLGNMRKANPGIVGKNIDKKYLNVNGTTDLYSYRSDVLNQVFILMVKMLEAIKIVLKCKNNARKFYITETVENL